jgi:micrococcal nuclease
MQPMRCLWAVLLRLLLTSPVLATELTGSVVGVLGGDIIEFLHPHHTELIRLSGIDCAEKGQVYGHKAKEAASALVFGKNVTLQIRGRDKCGRILADGLLPYGTNINYALVKEGWCWWSVSIVFFLSGISRVV